MSEEDFLTPEEQAALNFHKLAVAQIMEAAWRRKCAEYAATTVPVPDLPIWLQPSSKLQANRRLKRQTRRASKA